MLLHALEQHSEQGGCFTSSPVYNSAPELSIRTFGHTEGKLQNAGSLQQHNRTQSVSLAAAPQDSARLHIPPRSPPPPPAPGLAGVTPLSSFCLFFFFFLFLNYVRGVKALRFSEEGGKKTQTNHPPPLVFAPRDLLES